MHVLKHKPYFVKGDCVGVVVSKSLFNNNNNNINNHNKNNNTNKTTDNLALKPFTIWTEHHRFTTKLVIHVTIKIWSGNAIKTRS